MSGPSATAPSPGRPGRWRALGRAVRFAALGALAWLAVSPAWATGTLPAAPANRGPNPVGPIPLAEHLAWFAVLSLSVFLTYHALHVDSIRSAARAGVRRWLAFLCGSAVLAALSGLLAAWL